MFIRSEICHPPSSRSYSIVELKRYWSDLESAVLVFAEPKCYKDIVEMQIKTLQNCNLNALESAKIIEKISTESDRIMLAIQQETPLKIVDIEKLIKDGICGFENCVKSENNKTKSYINDTFQDFKENIEKHHEVLSTRCREEIQSTVTQESSNIRLHSEDQNRAIDSKMTESEQRVCQTVIQSQGRLEDKLIKEQNKTRNHTVELKADLIEENRILKDEVMDVKTELKELKTILIGYIGKQKVDLVMNTDQIEKSIESPENRKVDFTARVNQTHVTADKENKIIENLPPEIKIQTKNDCLSEEAVTETIEITGKKINSIILELKATPGILHSVENFKAAILTLVQVMQTAGGIDVDIEDTATVNLKFESPLTEDQFVVVKCLFANKSNSDSDTIQLADECSSISDEYLSTADVEKIESHSNWTFTHKKVIRINSFEKLFNSCLLEVANS
ncbi:unnamed protein product [Mytilus edulis]|uniref:Uncharacterized protein n=1 Tax=Mytilus edulis TaxID=6550 RepID=A0A8S3TQQ6_MYTED|nr:unnamed protein product [Mytilus edulis]